MTLDNISDINFCDILLNNGEWQKLHRDSIAMGLRNSAQDNLEHTSLLLETKQGWLMSKNDEIQITLEN